MSRRRLSATEWLALAVVTVLHGAPLLLHLLWRLAPRRTLSVLVWHKTVPSADCRERAGLHWVLKHLRFVRPEGDRYQPCRDYVGYVPTHGAE